MTDFLVSNRSCPTIWCPQKRGTKYFAMRYPAPMSQTKRMAAKAKGLAPAFLNFSMLVSAPSAVMAIVSRNVHRVLMKRTTP